MANSLKQLMSLSEPELIGLGAQYGLSFHAGMKKSQMAQQLSQSAASGWMEVNKELMSESPDGTYDEMVGFHGTSDMLSDAAHAAQNIHAAGMGGAFQHYMSSGAGWQVEAIDDYLKQLGATAQDVWMHLPKEQEDSHPAAFRALSNYMRDTLVGHQDIMPEIKGHHSGDILKEYSTKLGNIQDSYEHLSHMYLDKSLYENESQYAHDISRVSARLATQMGSRYLEVAASSAMGAHVSYMSTLPAVGDPSVVGNVAHARQPLNAAGLPLGSTGSAVAGREKYSLASSLTGLPENNPAAQSVYKSIQETVHNLAQVYKGGDNASTGMNPYKHRTSEYDMIMDSATRYNDVADVRSGYANLARELADEPSYSATNIRAILDNNHDKMDAESFAPVGIANPSFSHARIAEVGTSFTANLDSPTNWNSARMRREEKAIADLDASHANFRDVADGGQRSSGTTITYHDEVEQGSPEWHAMRSKYSITGSTIGSYLGNNAYTSPIKEMSDKLGINPKPRTSNFDMERGHRLEPIARSRVGREFGFNIGESGAITNSDYPDFLYSPDGLIGDDALWEHKAPRKFFDLKEHPDYNDQMQLGMLVSNRQRTLFSQTVGNETRSQWVERDPDWFSKNESKINSTLARMDVGHEVGSDNNFKTPEEAEQAARKAMTGEGIWGFRTKNSGEGYYTGGKRGMSRFSATAGTDEDEFAGRRSAFEPTNEDNGYRPNFVMQDNTQTGLSVIGQGSGNGVAIYGQAPSESNPNSLTNSVKEGILLAQEENRQRRGFREISEEYAEDADFEEEGISRSRFDRSNGGGGRRGGGGGGGRTPNPWDEQFGGPAGGAVARGIAGGSVSSATNGLMTAMATTPWGRAAAVAAGAVQIGAELADNANESLGTAQDAGMTNPVAFASQRQGMEMLGLSENQALNVAQTTHSAYNTLLNGDSSGAVRLVQGTRGLLTISDIRETEGDPVALARIIQERGRERGWSQARVAGAMDMAGLGGMARTYQREGAVQRAAEAVRDDGAATETDDAVTNTQVLRGVVRRASPEYGIQSAYFQHGANYAALAATGVQDALNVGNGVVNAGNSVAAGVENLEGQAKEFLDHFLPTAESGNREYDKHGNRITSPTGARGKYQILPSTARDPGFGLKPSDGTPQDDERLAREYMMTLVDRYNGDYEKANAAYTDGAGTVDKAVKNYGDDWLKHVPQQAQNRVAEYRKWSKSTGAIQQGAGGFAGSPMSNPVPTVINLNVNAQVNNKQATATVVATNGQTTTQTVNMGSGAQQRR
ncbi:tape measure protein [Pectobacterium phage PP101]|uniref:Tape measure protein n=1 Tax=Pectobacterium phage PP101 TaxID=1916414 RepID=A0A1J0MFJ2_9CAUD|nr:virion structural protein [Pectobacterium phage PP101]APD19722.1 tape measure protein [Pectobacterium phage PP101]